MKKNESLMASLETLCDGLIYRSETDAPVTPFARPLAGVLSVESILDHVDGSQQRPVDEVPFDEFFKRLTTIEVWFGEAEKVRAKKFLELRKVLEENLTGLRVFRIGRIQIEIFAMGVEPGGDAVGIRTRAVET